MTRTTIIDLKCCVIYRRDPRSRCRFPHKTGRRAVRGFGRLTFPNKTGFVANKAGFCANNTGLECERALSGRV